ncbi:MAG: hypothetical protein Q9217_004056 [Psora testacea]
MTKAPSTLQNGCLYLEKRVVEIWDNLRKNNLWRRILKNIFATTILGITFQHSVLWGEVADRIVSICLVPVSRTAIGRAGYLGAITTVFGHPGSRFGQMAEALILVVSVILTSTAQAVIPVVVTQIFYPILLAAVVIILVNVCLFPEFSSSFLGQMTIETLNDTTKALEEAGNYFVDVGTLIKAKSKVNNVALEGSWHAGCEGAAHDDLSAEMPQKPAHPDFLAILKQRLAAGLWKRKTQEGDLKASAPKQKPVTTMTDLAATKAKIRKKLTDCKAAQQECSFELAVAVLPPRDMRPISGHAMSRLVANTIATIGACESRFALVGEESDTGDVKLKENAKRKVEGQHKGTDGDTTSAKRASTSFLGLFDRGGKQTEEKEPLDPDKTELEAIKPKREIEFGDGRLLRYLTASISKPYMDCLRTIRQTFGVVNACVAYAYVRQLIPALYDQQLKISRMFRSFLRGRSRLMTSPLRSSRYTWRLFKRL